MFKSIRIFVGLVFTIMVFVGVAFPSLVREYESAVRGRSSLTHQIEMRYDVDETKDISLVTGETVVGMVPLATKGEYVLVVDGIVIQVGTDLDHINVSGVAFNKYRLSVVRNPVTKEVTVYANIIP